MFWIVILIILATVLGLALIVVLGISLIFLVGCIVADTCPPEEVEKRVFNTIDEAAEYIFKMIEISNGGYPRSLEQIRKDLDLISDGDASRITTHFLGCYGSCNYNGGIEEFVRRRIEKKQNEQTRNKRDSL